MQRSLTFKLVRILATARGDKASRGAVVPSRVRDEHCQEMSSEEQESTYGGFDEDGETSDPNPDDSWLDDLIFESEAEMEAFLDFVIMGDPDWIMELTDEELEALYLEFLLGEPS